MTTLGEYAKVQGGFAYKSKDFIGASEYRVLKIKNVRFGTIDYSEPAFVPKNIAESTINWKLKEGDILISMTGSGPNAPQSLVGRVARVWKNEPDAWFNQRVGRINLVDNKKIHPDFLFYWLSLPQNQDFLVSNSSGSANQANISGKTIESLPTPIVDYEISSAIAKIARELDEKIILNTQTNQTLEQIAQAIFKSWFVDFEPVKAKIETLASGGSADDAELAAISVISAKTLDELNSLKASNPEAFNKLAQTAALFPTAMQDSELGEIPKGWSYCTFGDISACFDSKRVPLSKRKREEKQPGTIPYYGATSVMDYVNEWIFDDTYLLLGEDGSVVKDDGTPFVQYIWGKSWVNNHAHVLQGNNGVSTEHLMVFIKGTNIGSYVTGAVQLKLNQKNMNSIPFLKASTEINLVFQGILNGLYDAYKNNIESSQSLSSLRDSLLPRLLSGEIELKDKE